MSRPNFNAAATLLIQALQTAAQVSAAMRRAELDGGRDLSEMELQTFRSRADISDSLLERAIAAKQEPQL